MQQMLAMGGGGADPDAPKSDTAEKIQISSLSLLKMLKHGIYCYMCNWCVFVVLFMLFHPSRSCWNPHGGHGSDARTVCG